MELLRTPGQEAAVLDEGQTSPPTQALPTTAPAITRPSRESPRVPRTNDYKKGDKYPRSGLGIVHEGYRTDIRAGWLAEGGMARPGPSAE